MTLAYALWLTVGLFVGSNLGVMLMCLLQINREPPTPEETPWPHAKKRECSL